ncbi:MAG: hypothetical protein OEN23_00800 [Paracoccaceae bacterium]|nr:hypothetical protein [Paracoccaceae bacterium]
MFGGDGVEAEFEELDALGEARPLTASSGEITDARPDDEVVLGAGQLMPEDASVPEHGFDELAASARLRASAASVIAEYEATGAAPAEGGDEAPGSDAIRAFLAAVNAGVSEQDEDKTEPPGGAMPDGEPDHGIADGEVDEEVTAEIDQPDDGSAEERPADEGEGALGSVPEPQGLDPEALKAAIREVLQEEFQGETGRSLSRNIQIMVRNEIDIALARKK